MAASAEDLLTSIYTDYDLVSFEEKVIVEEIDDKGCGPQGISPSDFRFLKKLVKEIKYRKG